MMQGILSGLTGVIADFATFVITAFMGAFEIVLEGILAVVGNITLPVFSDYSQYLIDFWDLLFQFVGYIRSIFLIDSFSMFLIYTMLLIRLTYKPIISIIKMFVEWFNKLKL